ncbi:hypothetical protein Bhyg_14579 [Pseudolycoriella hygida]|uniref:Uncharacterized protein n=1 Tax=Pseudolycoriella hygida TaxID=35572 RepID=A0A9Q0RXK3_9DIPT|nr:hypothetical protein Bhyg_14579 [Pseudolycoriella hygida]
MVCFSSTKRLQKICKLLKE